MTFSVVEVGWLQRGAERLGWKLPDLHTRTRILSFLAATFVPPALLAAVEGHLYGTGWVFSRDVAALVRFLWVGPLLIALEPYLRRELGAAVEGWRSEGLIPADRRPAFDRILGRLERLQRSSWIAAAALVGGCALAWLEVRARGRVVSASWMFSPGETGGLSLAGWWYCAISVPLLYFQLLRWLWRLLLWHLLLMRLASLPPRVLGLHPDRRGGLDTVVRAHNLFSGLLLALSSLAAAGLANQMLHGGASLATARNAAIVFLVIALVVFLGPLAWFTPLLLRLRRQSGSLYSKVVARHTADFESVARGVLASGPGSAERIPDNLIENQANFTQAFDPLREMRFSLLTLDSLKPFALAAAVPLLLAWLAKVPAAEVLAKLKTLLL